MKTLTAQLSCCRGRIPHNYIATHSDFEKEHYYDRDDTAGDREYLMAMSQMAIYRSWGYTVIQNSLGWGEYKKPHPKTNRTKDPRDEKFDKNMKAFRKAWMPKKPKAKPLVHIIEGNLYCCGGTPAWHKASQWVLDYFITGKPTMGALVTCPRCKTEIPRLII